MMLDFFVAISGYDSRQQINDVWVYNLPFDWQVGKTIGLPRRSKLAQGLPPWRN